MTEQTICRYVRIGKFVSSKIAGTHHDKTWRKSDRFKILLRWLHRSGNTLCLDFFQDYLTVGRTQPRLDTQQDWMLMNASEANNVTTLKFYRMRNTTDLQNDTAIPVRV